MRELQDLVEHRQRENDHLRAQVEKMHNLGEKGMQDSGQPKHMTARNKGKEHIVPDNMDTPTNDKLSSGNSPDLSPVKSSRARSHQRRLHCLAFSHANSVSFLRARRKIGRGQNQPNKVLGNASALHAGVMSPIAPMYPAFGTWPVLYIPPTAAIQGPHDMLSSPIGQHILNCEPPRGFIMLTFVMFDSSSDPYDHMLHYNQAMTLNVSNDHLLCKVFPASVNQISDTVTKN